MYIIDIRSHGFDGSWVSLCCLVSGSWGSFGDSRSASREPSSLALNCENSIQVSRTMYIIVYIYIHMYVCEFLQRWTPSCHWQVAMLALVGCHQSKWVMAWKCWTVARQHPTRQMSRQMDVLFSLHDFPRSNKVIMADVQNQLWSSYRSRVQKFNWSRSANGWYERESSPSFWSSWRVQELLIISEVDAE